MRVPVFFLTGFMSVALVCSCVGEPKRMAELPWRKLTVILVVLRNVCLQVNSLEVCLQVNKLQGKEIYHAFHQFRGESFCLSLENTVWAKNSLTLKKEWRNILWYERKILDLWLSLAYSLFLLFIRAASSVRVKSEPVDSTDCVITSANFKGKKSTMPSTSLGVSPFASVVSFGFWLLFLIQFTSWRMCCAKK